MAAIQNIISRCFGLACLSGLAVWSGCATKPAVNARSAAPPAAAATKLQNGVESFDAAWRIIHESHFDTNFNGVNWEAVRVELRPQAEAATELKQLRVVIMEMLGRLGQSHMILIPRESVDAMQPASASVAAKRSATKTSPQASRKSKPASSSQPALASAPENPSELRAGDLGFEVRRVDQQIVVTRVEAGGPAHEAGVRSGWVVQAVGGRRTSELLELAATVSDPRRASLLAWSMVAAQLNGRPDSTSSLEFLDNADQPVSLEIKRRRVVGEPAKLGHLPTFFARLQSERMPAPGGGSIGVIRFNVWMLPIAEPFNTAIDELRDTQGIVIDVRGNIGGMAGMIMGFSGHFLNDRIPLGTLKTRSATMRFVANPRLVTTAGQRVQPFAGPVAILTDPVSISASEIFAGGLQAIGRARVFGQATTGQALPALFDALPNGDVLEHAMGDFLTPNGARVEGRGVVPDEVIPLTRADLLAGRDAALMAAMKWIASQHHQGSASSSASVPDQPVSQTP